MKKLVVFIILAAIALMLVFALSGCAVMSSGAYENSELYSVGDAEIADKIENIEIDWPSGSVTVVTHSENTLLLTEKTGDGTSDDLRVHWWLEQTTLHVKFAASGEKLRLFSSAQKELTLTVPETISFDDIVIRSTSAEIDVRGLAAEAISVSAESGNVSISCAAKALKLNTTSGKISADLRQADKVNLESVSGKINVTAASINSLSVKATSGAVSCELGAAPSECKLRAVSGSIDLVLPDDPDFTARISTTSGDFESDFALKKDGNVYICGSGSANIDIKTTSGDVSILKS